MAAAKHIALKDAPIVAAAKKTKVDFLITLDKKHLLDILEVAQFAGLPIVTPQQAFESISGGA